MTFDMKEASHIIQNAFQVERHHPSLLFCLFVRLVSKILLFTCRRL